MKLLGTKTDTELHSHVSAVLGQADNTGTPTEWGGLISSKPAPVDQHWRIFFWSADILGTIRLIVSRPPTWKQRKSLPQWTLTESDVADGPLALREIEYLFSPGS